MCVYVHIYVLVLRKSFLYKTLACRDGAGKKHKNKVEIKTQKTNLAQNDGEERQEEYSTSVLYT